jgi:hypothetical protein
MTERPRPEMKMTIQLNKDGTMDATTENAYIIF